MKKSTMSLCLVILSTFLLSASVQHTFVVKSNKKPTPNFIFYLADDQDQLDYGCYGNPKVYTPAVDKLAKEGMRFQNAYVAQSICAPSRSQIYTGLYAIKNGCFANHIGVKPSVSSVTTYLKEAGYEVVLAGKSHVKPNDVFDWTHYFPSVNHRFLPLEDIDTYLKEATKPFCLFIASDYPHGPYPKETEYTANDIFKLPYTSHKPAAYKTGYYQNIKNDNAQLEKIVAMVDKYKLEKNSVFVYASDHGISGKWGVSEPGLRVPLVVKWPGKIKANSASNTLVSLIDILPTFLDIIDVPIPDYLDGKSFYRTLQGEEASIHDYIFGIATKQNIQHCKVFPSRMVRGKQYKYIRNYNSIEVVENNLGDNEFVNAFIEKGAKAFPKKPFEELYDLKTDPYEKKNLAKNKNYQKEKEHLAEVLEAWMISQDDFLVHHKMPLLKPTLHPLDRNSKWNKVPSNLKGKLTADDYIKLHY